jgi:hypothetical protein
MERSYKGQKIVRNMNGNWIITWANGGHTQHNTLSDAKEQITFVVGY